MNVSPIYLCASHSTTSDTVQLDKSNTRNELYISFYRGEIKAVQKTRALQTSYSDQLVRLQNELVVVFDIIQFVQQCEILK